MINWVRNPNIEGQIYHLLTGPV